MDFGTIRTRVESDHYPSVAAFEADMLLVTSNATLFNPPESAYHSTASRIANWLERAIPRECEDVITPTEEEALRAEEKERQAQIERNIAMGLRPDGKPKRKKWRKGQITVPDNYVPAALRFGVDLTTGSGPSTEGTGTPRTTAGTAAEQKRDQSGSRSVTPGRRGRVSASPFVSRDSYADSPAAGTGTGRGSPSAQPDLDDDDDDTGAGASQGAGGSRQRTMASHLRRRLAPRGSILRGRHSTSSTPRITAELVQQMESQSSALPLSYLPDGSIDPSDIEDPASTLLGISADQMLPPTLESIVPIALEHVDAASLRKNPVKGLEATVLAEPGPIEDSYSHDLSSLPPPSQHAAFGLPGHLAGPWQPLLDLKAFGAPLRWPMAGASTSAAGPSAATASSSAKSKVDPKNFDWSYNHLRQRVRRLLSTTDLGPFGTVVPARAVNTQGMLSEYNYLHGASLQIALLDELSASAGLALKLPGTPGVPKDLTHLIWTNMYRDYRPQLAQMLEAGAKSSDLLRDTVFGGAPGEAYARSVAEFVSGAARGVEERMGPEEMEVDVKEEAADEQQVHAERNGLRKRSASEDEVGPVAKKAKLEQEEEDDGPTHTATEPVPIAALDKPLIDWVRENLMNPLTEGQLSILEQVAAGFAAAISAEELRQLEKELASEGALISKAASAEADTDAEKGNKEASHASGEQAEGILDELRQALGEQDSQGTSPSKMLDLYTATRLAESINDPTARMRLFELEHIQGARIDLSEMIVPDSKIADPGASGIVINKETGEQLYRITDDPDSLAVEKIDEALRQYGRVMQDVSKRIRDPDTKALLEGLRKALLLIVIKKVEAKEMLPLPKHLITYLQGIQQQQQQGAVNPFAAANAAVKTASPVASKT